MRVFLLPHFLGNCLFTRVAWVYSSNPVVRVSNSQPLGGTRLKPIILTKGWALQGLWTINRGVTCRSDSPLGQSQTSCVGRGWLYRMWLMSSCSKSPDHRASAERAKHPFQGSANTHEAVRRSESASNRSFLKSIGKGSLLALDYMLSCPRVLLWHGNSSVVSFQMLADLMSYIPYIPWYLMSDVLLPLCNTPNACGSHQNDRILSHLCCCSSPCVVSAHSPTQVKINRNQNQTKTFSENL